MHVIHICLLLQMSLTRSYSSGITTGAYISTPGFNGLHWYGGWGWGWVWGLGVVGWGVDRGNAVSCFHLIMALRHKNFFLITGVFEG